MSKPIAIGADDAALELKELLAGHMRSMGLEVEDYSPPSPEAAKEAGTDYPDVAVAVAEAVARGEHERAVLCCGTGIGVAIAANKVPGVRAAQCHDAYSAERARASNDAQVITMGARVVGPELARAVLTAWLGAEYAGGRSAQKVEKLRRLDERYDARGAGQGQG